MAGIELSGTLKVLKGERAKIHSDLAKLDKAITVLEELSGTLMATPNGSGHRRTLSVAARKKIAKAQKARWAKVRQQRAAKG